MARRKTKGMGEIALNVQDDTFEYEYGYNYDYVVVFPVYNEDVELNAQQKAWAMRTILHRLSSGGLETKMFYSSSRKEVFCKIRASLDRLCKEADRIDYKLELDPSELRKIAERGIPEHGISPMIVEDIKAISHRNVYDCIFSKYDMDPRLQHLFKKYGRKRIPFRGVDRLKLIQSIVKSRLALGGSGLDIHQLLHDNCILAFFPLHTIEEKNTLKENWMLWAALPSNQPFAQLKDYYGEKIALYFAWLGHYTTWLVAPSIVGGLVMIDVVLEGTVDSRLVPFFGLFMGFWSTFYLEYWKRRNASLALEWGMIGYENEEQDRPQFVGEEIPSPVDGSTILWFNPAHKARRIMASLVFVVFLLLLVIAFVAAIFVFRYFSQKGQSLAPMFTWYGVNVSGALASVCNAIQIQVMNALYGSLAVKLNDYENHRTDTEYEDHLIAKTFLFQFVNSYASCFYIAFIKNIIPNEECRPNCMAELSTTLGIIFVLRLTYGNFTEIVLPWLRRKVKARPGRECKLRSASMVEEQYYLSVYDNMGTFGEYSEMVIQFGYATLFVVAFPLAPLLALLNNYAEIRVDAYKLCLESRRPEPMGAEDIGTWYSILEIMATISVMTNAGIVVFTSDNGLTMEWKMWLFILVEHIVLLMKFAVSVLLDDVPHDVKLQQERSRYFIEKIVSLVPDDDDTALMRGNKVQVDLTILDSD